MLGPLGFPEILMLLVLALLVFGPKRLPEMGRMIGKGIGEFRRATADLKNSVSTELALNEAVDGRQVEQGADASHATTAEESADAASSRSSGEEPEGPSPEPVRPKAETAAEEEGASVAISR